MICKYLCEKDDYAICTRIRTEIKDSTEVTDLPYNIKPDRINMYNKFCIGDYTDCPHIKIPKQ